MGPADRWSSTEFNGLNQGLDGQLQEKNARPSPFDPQQRTANIEYSTGKLFLLKRKEEVKVDCS